MAAPALRRVLGLFDLCVLAAAAMGPAFSLAGTMGPMVAAAGGVAPYALLAVTVIMMFIAVAFTRLLAVLPSAGTSYSWMSAAFGPSAGAYAAWVLLLGNFFATLATSLPAGTYTLDLIAPSLASSPLWTAVVGAIWIVASALLLYAGARPTAKVATALLVLEFAVLFVAAVASVLHPAPPVAAAVHAPHIGWQSFLAAMVIGIWMLDGWEVSASVSEESSGNTDAAGDGGMVGLLVTSAVLFLCMMAFMHVGTVQGFTDHPEDAMAYVAQQLGSPIWHVAIVTVVLISVAGALQTTLLYLSRSVYAMGRDGVLPPALGRLDRRKVPTRSILTITLGVLLATLATGLWAKALDIYTIVISGSGVFLGVLFLFSSMSAVRLFRSDKGRKFWTGVVIPATGSLLLAAIIVVTVQGSDFGTLLFIVGGALLGVPFALWRRRSTAAGMQAAAQSSPSLAAPEG